MIDVRRVLSSPTVYELFSRGIGGKRARTILVARHVRPFRGARVLDLGCGPGTLLEHLGDVTYVGIDTSEEYIDRARRSYGERAEFRVGDATALDDDLRGFDLVLAFGVLHHLDDGAAGRLFEGARSALVPEGRLITLDNAVIAEEPRRVADRIISWDRGAHVRAPADYERLAAGTFRDVRCTVHRDLLRIPYTHCVLECSGNGGAPD
jgi:SAM-dependent methyltransferase